MLLLEVDSGYHPGVAVDFTGTKCEPRLIWKLASSQALKLMPEGEDVASKTLHALASFPKAPGARRTTEELHRRTLASITSIILQHVSAGVSSDDYQMSFAVDAEAFWATFQHMRFLYILERRERPSQREADVLHYR